MSTMPRSAVRHRPINKGTNPQYVEGLNIPARQSATTSRTSHNWLADELRPSDGTPIIIAGRSSWTDSRRARQDEESCGARTWDTRKVQQKVTPKQSNILIEDNEENAVNPTRSQYSAPQTDE